MEKWNYETHQYEPYKAPEHALLYTDDMSEKCQCAQCGAWMTYGEGYASEEIHNSLGLGYCVCEECKNLELERLLKARRAKPGRACK